MIKKLLTHIERWNIWRRYNVNGRFYKLLVLLGFTKSPTMCFVYTKEERERYFGYLEKLK